MPSFSKLAAFAGLATLAFASPVEKVQKRGVNVHINQVQVGSVPKIGAAAIQKALVKFGKPVPTVVAAAAETGTVSAIPEQFDAEYLCPVTVGGTTLNLDFDTGSADLWVFSDKLPKTKQTGHSIYKTGTGKLKSGSSWSISYGDGSGASGIVYADKVVIGGVTATSQAVEAATSISTQFTQDTDNDGLVGLAFSSINTVKPQPAKTFFDTVSSSLDQPLFCADLKKGTAGSYDFGFIDTSKYTGDIVYTDVDSSQGFWMFTADSYSIGSGSSSGSSGKKPHKGGKGGKSGKGSSSAKSGGSLSGIADTGTTLMLVDDSVVSAYYAQVQGAQNDQTQGGYVFPCDATLPDFSLVIGGQTRTVPGSYINYAPADSTNCFGGIQSNSGVGFSIFGDIFLKSQYVVFDMSTGSPRIGFGQQA